MPRLYPSELTGRAVWWLLDIQYAGQVLRLSDREGEVLTDAGEAIHYVGTLEGLDVEEGLEFLQDASANPTSAAISAVFPVDVPQLVAMGHDLAGATGTLSRWVEGTTYEARRVVVRGQIVDPEYGAAEEPVSCSLELTPWSDSKTIPAPGLEVAGTQWDSAMILSLPPGGLGLRYPIVIGRPGRVDTAIWNTGIITGSQAVYVDQRRTLHTSGGHVREVTPLLAAHHVTAQTVYLKTATDTTFLRYKVINTFDRAGHPIAVAPWWFTKSPATADDFEYVASASYTWNPPTTVNDGSIGSVAAPASIQPGPNEQPAGTYVGWYDLDNPEAGGLQNDDGTLMRAAGDVLQWLMRQSGHQVDRGRFAAVRALLQGYRLDLTIDEETTPWEYVRAHILPILPVSIVAGPEGLYPVVWRFDATAADAIAHIDTGLDPQIQRMSAVTYDRSTVRNDITLRYAYAVRTGQYLGELRYAADATDGAFPALVCNLSQRRYLRPDGSSVIARHTVESPCIYDDATAHAVLQWMTRAYALARRRVSYILPESDWGWLERGQVVTLTDAELYLTGQVAIVESIRIDGSPMIQLGFLLIEQPARDARLIP